jgi:hypothetical protein
VSKPGSKCRPCKQRQKKSGAKNSTVKRRDSDSDGQTESDGEHDNDFKEKLKRLIAESKKGRTSTTHKAENNDHVFQRFVSQGNKLNADHIQALVSCHNYRDGVSLIQHTAAEIIRQSVNQSFTLFPNYHTPGAAQLMWKRYVSQGVDNQTLRTQSKRKLAPSGTSHDVG